MSRPPSPAAPSSPVFSDTDRDMMRRALTLAAEGRFSTSPNPRVGCIIAHGGQIVGQGFHLKAGGPHAEVHALRQAGENARGATAYVTLEPCSHYGRTPPCAEALIQAGVSRVVAAIADPNPQVAGKGLAMLSAAGIRTESGLLETEARELNRPFVRLKCAASLDGKTALSDGLSQWITGEAARHDVQILRAESCAVLTGIGTVLADDPQLNVRAFPTLRQPLRIVLDSRLRLPPTAKLLADPESPVLLLTAVPPEKYSAALIATPHLDILTVPAADGRISLPAALPLLAERGIGELLVEAGATLCGAFLQSGLVDEIVLYQAGKILGGNARSLFDLPENPAALQQPASWQTRSVAILDGGDLKQVLRKKEIVY